MLWRARDELGAEFAASWVIGDGARHIELAARAGCRGAVWLRAPAEPAPVRKPPRYAEAADLEETTVFILRG
jgi:FMN phosphatase YigB (HAD superfamily)